MKHPETLHTLAGPGLTGQIKFIHSDGKEHTFTSCINSLSGSRLTWFDSDPPRVDDTLKYVRSVFRDIRKKSVKVLSSVGDF